MKKKGNKGKKQKVLEKEEKKNSVFKMISESFVKWKQNFVIVLPMIFNVLALFFILALFLLVFIFLFASKIGGTDLETLSEEAIFAIFSPGFISVLVFIILVGFVLFLFISSYFSAGATGMALDIWKKKRVSLKTMHSYGKKFLKRYFLLNLVLGILFFLLSVFFLIIWALFFLDSFVDLITNQVFNLPAVNSVLFFLLFVFILPLFIFLFFYLSQYIMIQKNIGVKDSIKKSIRISKKNYFSLLGLFAMVLFIYSFVSIVVEFIPTIGGFLDFVFSYLFLIPIFILVLMKFVLNRE